MNRRAAQWTADELLVLAEPAVVAVAPEELPLLAPTVNAATRWPRVGDDRSRSEEMLGFGWDESVPAATVAAVGAAQAVLGFLAAQAVDAVREETSGAVRERVRALFRRRDRTGGADGAGERAALDQDRLRQVRRIAYAKALDLGLDRAQAELMADAIVGRLAAPEPDEPA